jgi:hypothetical protein
MLLKNKKFLYDPNGRFMRIRMRIRRCGSGLGWCFCSFFFVELYSGAFVHWLRIHLCGSASGTMETILKCVLLFFLVDGSGVAAPFLIMFSTDCELREKKMENVTFHLKNFFGSTVADPHPKKRAAAPYFN